MQFLLGYFSLFWFQGRINDSLDFPAAFFVVEGYQKFGTAIVLEEGFIFVAPSRADTDNSLREGTDKCMEPGGDNKIALAQGSLDL